MDEATKLLREWQGNRLLWLAAHVLRGDDRSREFQRCAQATRDWESKVSAYLVEALPAAAPREDSEFGPVTDAELDAAWTPLADFVAKQVPGEPDALDAARYRFMRRYPTDTQQFGRRYWGDELDAKIDAAMQAKTTDQGDCVIAPNPTGVQGQSTIQAGGDSSGQTERLADHAAKSLSHAGDDAADQACTPLSLPERLEHIASRRCWCEPIIVYTAESGVRVWLHRSVH